MHHYSSESHQQKVCQHRLPFQGNPSQWNLLWGRRKLSLGSADPRSNTSSHINKVSGPMVCTQSLRVCALLCNKKTTMPGLPFSLQQS